MTTKCQVPRCRNELGIIYIDKPVCWDCWVAHCRGKINLKEILGVK